MWRIFGRWRTGCCGRRASSKGYVRTEMPYADYKLHLEWRWPKGPGNSGIMFHLVNGDMLWPKSFRVPTGERPGG